MKNALDRFYKWFLLFFTTTIILFAVLINIARFVTPWCEKHSSHFESWASKVLHHPVQINHVQASWQGFNPSFSFEHVIITDANYHRPLLKIQHLSVAINLFQSLMQWRLVPGRVTLSGAELDIHNTQQQGFHVNGVVAHQPKNELSSLGTMKQVVGWFLNQSDIQIKKINIIYFSKSGKKATIKNLNLHLSDSIMKHQLVGDALVGDQTPVHFVFDFKDNYLNVDHLNAKFYVKVDGLDLSQELIANKLVQTIPTIKDIQGKLSFESWVKVGNGKLRSIQVLLHGQQCSWDSESNKKSSKLHDINANLYWKKGANGWRLIVNKLNLRLNGLLLNEHDFGLRVIDTGKQRGWLIKTTLLDLAEIREIANVLGKGKVIKQKLLQYASSGELRNLRLFINKQSAKKPRYFLDTAFDHLNFNGLPYIYRGRNLSGTLHYSPMSGKLLLQSPNSLVELKKIINHEFKFRHLNLEMSWKNSSHGVIVNANHLFFDDGNISCRGIGKVNIPLNQSPIFDINSHFQLQDVSKIRDYIPQRIINIALKNWLESAFLKGSLQHGRFALKGSLADYPFIDRQGDFFASAEVNGLQLHFLNKWPKLSDLSAQVIFHNDKLRVEASHGRIAENPLTNVVANIPNLRKPVLSVSGHSNSNLNDLLGFVHKVPLNLSQRLNSIKGYGATALDISLNIPLSNASRNTTVAGRLSMKNTSIDFTNARIPLSHVNGIINFKNKSVSSQNLQALLFGQSIFGRIETTNVDTSRTALQVTIGGELSVDMVQNYLHLPSLKWLSGTTPFRAILRVPDNTADRNSSLNLTSDLVGVKINSPKPFGKQVAQSRLLNLYVDISHNGIVKTKINYSQILQAALMKSFISDKKSHINGEIHLGVGEANYQKKSGIIITGSLNNFNWSQWKKILFNYQKSNSPSTKLSTNIRSISLNIKDFNSGVLKLFHLKVSAFHNRNGWLAYIDNSSIKGNFLIPKNKNTPCQGRFEKLYLPKSKNLGKKWNPKDIPPIDLQIQDFHYGNYSYGRINLKLMKKGNDLFIDKFEVLNPSFSIHTFGSCLSYRNSPITQMRGTFSSHNLGDFLRNWNLSTVLDGGEGAANFELSWRGAPYQFEPKKLSGNVELKFRHGRILQIAENAQPELGIGRLLNLLSLQSLPELPLKIIHLTKHGFEFNLFRGGIHLNHGVISTSNLSVVGGIAWVRIKGMFGFSKKNYDFYLQIIPNVTSSLPLIVAIAGGPLAGAIAWLANRILAPHLGKAAEINYHIVGTLTHPKVTQLPLPERTSVLKSVKK